jgi:hypothetical protein
VEFLSESAHQSLAGLLSLSAVFCLVFLILLICISNNSPGLLRQFGLVCKYWHVVREQIAAANMAGVLSACFNVRCEDLSK